MLVSPEGGKTPDPEPADAAEPTPAQAKAEPPRRAARPAAPTFHVAGFWRRLVAAAVDTAVVIPVGSVLAWLAVRVAGVELPAARHRGIDFWLDLLLASDPAVWGTLGLIAAIGCTYLLVFHVTMGRTLGMRLLGLRVIDIYGDAPTMGRAVTRTLGYLAGLATLGLGFLWVGFDGEKRGLHDWVSGTYVVKA